MIAVSLLSRIPSRSWVPPAAERRSGFLRAQRLAYQCVQEVAGQVREGMTNLRYGDYLPGDRALREG